MFASMMMMLASTNVPVHVGIFDPAKFPDAKKIERRMPHADLNNRVEKMLDGRCQIAGQTQRKFDIVVPYAVRMNGSNEATQVVVKEIGCEPLERLVGEIAVELSKAGDFRGGQGETERWYVSEAYFTRTSEEATRKMADLDKVVCKADKPKINSRIAMVKTCRTVAEWKIYDTDREQFRRDFNAGGAMTSE